MTRVLFVAAPSYNQWPASIKEGIAIVALMYRDVEATLCGGNISVDDKLRPRPIDYPRLIAELSQTISTMPLLKGVELTVDDCLLREHNEYIHLMQPKGANGATSDPSLASIRKIENTIITTPRPTHFALSYGFLVSAFGSCIRCHLDSYS